MTRISDHLLVQRLDDGAVVVDESTGEEVVIPLAHMVAVASTLEYLAVQRRVAQSTWTHDRDWS